MKRSRMLLLAAMLLCHTAAAQTNSNLYTHVERTHQEVLDNLDAYCRQIQNDWKLPGMYIQVGNGYETIFAKAYGYSDPETGAPITDKSIFQIASVTKSFTTYLLATLVDEGLISWDDKVCDILDDFRMYDPWVTDNMLIKDVTCHRAGLANEAGTRFQRLGYNRDDVYHAIAAIRPNYPFRAGYEYNDVMFQIAARIIVNVTGKSYEQNLQERIFDPLGMSGTILLGPDYTKAVKEGRAARPYRFGRSADTMALSRVPDDYLTYKTYSTGGPQGGICCPPGDLMKWAQFHLNGGVAGGKRLISKEQMDFLHTAMNIIWQNETGIKSYAHGWFVEQSRKAKIIFHTGTNAGIIALCAFIPDHNLTFTLQATGSIGPEPRFAIMYRLVDLVLGLEDYDYDADYLARWYAGAAAAYQDELRHRSDPDWFKPAPASELLVGKYRGQDVFGDMQVVGRNGRIWLKVLKNNAEYPLKHVNGKRFLIEASAEMYAEFEFGKGEDNKATALNIDFMRNEHLDPWVRSEVTVIGRITDRSTGRGIAGVPVTDGYSYVRTDSLGRYSITPDSRAQKIYYTTPAAYEVALDEQSHLPAFYSAKDISDKRRQRIDFKLTPLKDGPEKDFTLVMIGDPQCTMSNTVARYSAETVEDIKATAASCGSPVYAVTLGDVTYDSAGIWDEMAASMSNVSVNGRYLPFFQCMGNHDHNSLVEDTDNDADDDYRAHGLFVKTFGPSDYSFDRGDAHIVVMDDIMVTGKHGSSKPNKFTWSYSGGFSPEQLEWLRQDLACVDHPEDKLLIFCVHIPFRGADAKNDRLHKEVVSMMKTFRECHIMAGHSHLQENYIHKAKTVSGSAIYEHIHGTACGAWWASNSCLCGTPCGYNVYSISGANVRDWRFKGTGRDKDYQFRVYDGSQIYTGKAGLEFNWYDPAQKHGDALTKGFPEAKGALVAEVFDNDSENWRVELWVNDEKAADFIRKEAKVSNAALASFWQNEQGRTGRHWRGSETKRYWYCPLPEDITMEDIRRHDQLTGNACGVNWEVRAIFTVPTDPSVSHTYTVAKLTTDYSEF